MTVLIVDDDGGIREILHRLIVRDFGAYVVEAADGLVALQRLVSDPVDLVILDLVMPGMSGIETLAAIRRSPAYATVPVVVLSGQSDESRVIQASRLGIMAFLAKPFTIASLRERLSPLISSVMASAPNTRPPSQVLELSPSQRVLIVDSHPEFRSFFRERFREVCRVDEADDQSSATKLCIAVPHEAVFVGTTAEPVHVPAFRGALNRAGRLVAPRVIGVVPSADLEAARLTGTYDDVVVRSFVGDTFDRSLRHVIGEQTRARLFFGGSSESAAALFDFARTKVESLLPHAVTVEGLRPFPRTADRWVSATVELQSTGLAWEVRARAPFASALDLAGARLDLQIDQVSEPQVLDVASLLATELADGLLAHARERGVEGKRGKPYVSLTRADALARTESARPGAGRWLLTPRHHPALVVQLALSTAYHT